MDDITLISLSVYNILKSKRAKLAAEKRKIKKRPSYRVNPYLAERNTKGRFAKDFKDMQTVPQVFHENFHMSLETFMELFALVEEDLLPKRVTRKDIIGPMQKLAAVLEFLASGSISRHVASVYRISKQHFSKIIDDVCDAIIKNLSPHMPQLDQSLMCEISEGFSNRWQFPNCVGSMDGKHVAVKAPAKSGSIFYNYKGFHSIVLFAVADYRYKFTYLDIGAYGSEGDANIFANCTFGKAVLGDTLEFPEDASLGNENIPFYFIGDDAFPLCKRVIKPYSGKNKLTTEQTIFNYRLSRARRTVENAFGILCSKWTCLKRTMFTSPDKAQKCVGACCLLHNYLLDKKQIYCPPGYGDYISPDGKLIEGEWRRNITSARRSSLIDSTLEASRGRQCDVGKIIRDKVKNYVNSPAGRVEWQEKAIFLK